MTNEAAILPNSLFRLPVTLLQRSGTIAFLVLLAVVLLLIAVSPNHISYFDLSTISTSGTTLVLAGIGETIVVLGGGLDLSPGAVISLVNVVLVTQLGSSTLGVVPYTALATAIALGIGAGVGAINGLLVSYLRLPCSHRSRLWFSGGPGSLVVAVITSVFSVARSCSRQWAACCKRPRCRKRYAASSMGACFCSR